MFTRHYYRIGLSMNSIPSLWVRFFNAEPSCSKAAAKQRSPLKDSRRTIKVIYGASNDEAKLDPPFHFVHADFQGLKESRSTKIWCFTA
jgi:hypothetical protein